MILKLKEARIQSKFIKPGHIMLCKIVTDRITWKSKAVPSSINPVWQESKNFPVFMLKIVKIEVFQFINPENESILGFVSIPINDLFSKKKSWWAVYTENFQIGTIFLHAKGPFIEKLPENLSSRVLTSEKKNPLFYDFSSNEERFSVQEYEIHSFVEKINAEHAKIGMKKSRLKEIKEKIKLKEAFLLEERKEVEKQKKELADERKFIQNQRFQLSKEYSELKNEKFRQRTNKILLNSRQRKILGLSAQVLRQMRLVNKGPESVKKGEMTHSFISLTECVKPVVAFSDSPPDESPIHTQESM